MRNSTKIVCDKQLDNRTGCINRVSGIKRIVAHLEAIAIEPDRYAWKVSSQGPWVVATTKHITENIFMTSGGWLEWKDGKNLAVTMPKFWSPEQQSAWRISDPKKILNEDEDLLLEWYDTEDAARRALGELCESVELWGEDSESLNVELVTADLETGEEVLSHDFHTHLDDVHALGSSLRSGDEREYEPPGKHMSS